MNIKQHKFVTEYLRFGDKAVAYKNAYNTATANYKTLESSANRLLRIPEIARAIEEARARIREQVEKEVAEQQKGELLTIQKKRELLYQIATGEMHVLQYHKGKDCNTCTQYVTPTINQMLRAIHLDNKLAGHYPLYTPVTAREYLPRQVRTKQPHENTDKQTQNDLSPAGGGDRRSGVEPLAQENTYPVDLRENAKTHNNSQQLIDCLNPQDQSKDKMNLSKTQQNLRTKSPRNLSRRWREGDRGPLATYCPPLAGVSAFRRTEVEHSRRSDNGAVNPRRKNITRKHTTIHNN